MEIDIGLLIPKSGNLLLIGKPQAKGFVKENVFSQFVMKNNLYVLCRQCLMNKEWYTKAQERILFGRRLQNLEFSVLKALFLLIGF